MTAQSDYRSGSSGDLVRVDLSSYYNVALFFYPQFLCGGLSGQFLELGAGCLLSSGRALGLVLRSVEICPRSQSWACQNEKCRGIGGGPDWGISSITWADGLSNGEISLAVLPTAQANSDFIPPKSATAIFGQETGARSPWFPTAEPFRIAERPASIRSPPLVANAEFFGHSHVKS